MATREITDEQAGEIADRLYSLTEWARAIQPDAPYEADGILADVNEIRRLLGFA